MHACARRGAGLAFLCALATIGCGDAAATARPPAQASHPVIATRRAHQRRGRSPHHHQREITVKAPILGLVDKGSQAPYTERTAWPTATPGEVAPDAAAFSGIVVNESWAQLEPQQNHFTFGPLTASLDAVSAYNHAHRHDALEVKLRLWGGFTAPEWAKTLGGLSPVSFDTPSASGTTGRWWTTAYRDAWSSFQRHLAKAFDGNSLVHTVAVSSCMTLTAEPFVFSPSPSLHAELFADGWSSAAQQRCLLGAFSDYSGWKRTPIEYTFNPFVSYSQGTDRGTPDPSFTDMVMSQCARLSARTNQTCILSNHALDTDAASTSASAPVYAEMDALYTGHRRSTQVDFQTDSPDSFGGCQAIDVAVAHHGHSLELWPPSRFFQGYSAFSPSELAQWASAVRHGHRLTC